MSEIDPTEATRREFEAVMRLSRFATIEQVAADLELNPGRRPPIATMESPPEKRHRGAPPSLPTRSSPG